MFQNVGLTAHLKKINPLLNALHEHEKYDIYQIMKCYVGYHNYETKTKITLNFNCCLIRVNNLTSHIYQSSSIEQDFAVASIFAI